MAYLGFLSPQDKGRRRLIKPVYCRVERLKARAAASGGGGVAGLGGHRVVWTEWRLDSWATVDATHYFVVYMLFRAVFCEFSPQPQ